MASSNRGYGTGSEFYCVKCGQKGFPLRRKNGSQRQAGHLKKLYCLHCKQETNHYEVREFDLMFNYEQFKQDIADGKYKDVECEK